MADAIIAALGIVPETIEDCSILALKADASWIWETNESVIGFVLTGVSMLMF